MIQRQAKSIGINAVPGEGSMIEGQGREAQVPTEEAIHSLDDPGRPVLSDIEHATFMTAGAACL